MSFWDAFLCSCWSPRKKTSRRSQIEKHAGITSYLGDSSVTVSQTSQDLSKEKPGIKSVVRRIESVTKSSAGPDIGPDFTYLYPHFVHAPLDLSRDEFRLVKIERDPTRNPPVQLRLQTFATDDRPAYTALSYTWGGYQNQRDVAINDCRIKIRPNLLSFLQTAALSVVGASDEEKAAESEEPIAAASDNSHWYWIDAICINQSNTLERNHQVGLMSKIYNDASKVIAYLGPADENTDTACDLITQFNDSSETPFKALDRYYESAILPLLQRPLWRRLWVAQEILLARELVVQCGVHTIEWTDLSIFIVEYLGLNEAKKQHEIPQHVATIVQETERSEDGNKRRTLSHMIEVFASFECMDTRDRIFALQAIDSPEAIVVDYKKPMQDLYLEVLGNVAAFQPDKSIEDHIAFSETLRQVLKLDRILEPGLMEKFMTEKVYQGILQDATSKQRPWESHELKRPPSWPLTSTF